MDGDARIDDHVGVLDGHVVDADVVARGVGDDEALALAGHGGEDGAGAEAVVGDDVEAASPLRWWPWRAALLWLWASDSEWDGEWIPSDSIVVHVI